LQFLNQANLTNPDISQPESNRPLTAEVAGSNRIAAHGHVVQPRIGMPWRTVPAPDGLMRLSVLHCPRVGLGRAGDHWFEPQYRPLNKAREREDLCISSVSLAGALRGGGRPLINLGAGTTWRALAAPREFIGFL